MANKQLTTDKPKRGRPKAIEVTEEVIKQAEMLASQGLNQRQIAAYFGVNKDTITARRKESQTFSDAIKRGRAKGVASIANALFQTARQGNTTAQIFYLKTVGGFHEAAYVDEPEDVARQANLMVRRIYAMELGDVVDGNAHEVEG